MASFRRTFSLMQRDGAASNGETFAVSSPSQKSPYSQSYPASGGLASMFSSMDEALQRIVFGIFSLRSRHLERSRLKGQFWKKAFFHFFVCFMVGTFIGLTPFISVDFSVNLVSKQQAFSFEVTPARSMVQSIDIVKNKASLLENKDYKGNVSFKKEVMQEPRGEINNTLSSIQPVEDSDFVYQKLLIIVTPMQPRPFQAYYLNRLAHTLKLVPPPLLWIAVEMSAQSAETAEILRNTGIMYRHLVCKANLTGIKDRRVHQRNVALAHIETHRLDGIVYFANDHNVYSVDLFQQMREIRRFGTWSVARLTGSKNKVVIEGPVCNNSQVVGWHTSERSKRTQRFHVDMSGFAFNSTILWDPKGWHRPTPESIRQLDRAKEGHPVSTFIEQVVEDESQMECLPNDFLRIMVWHLHLEAPKLPYPQGWLMQKNLDVIATLT